jgi:hypothetical protein
MKQENLTYISFFHHIADDTQRWIRWNTTAHVWAATVAVAISSPPSQPRRSAPLRKLHGRPSSGIKSLRRRRLLRVLLHHHQLRLLHPPRRQRRRRAQAPTRPHLRRATTTTRQGISAPELKQVSASRAVSSDLLRFSLWHCC